MSMKFTEANIIGEPHSGEHMRVAALVVALSAVPPDIRKSVDVIPRSIPAVPRRSFSSRPR